MCIFTRRVLLIYIKCISVQMHLYFWLPEGRQECCFEPEVCQSKLLCHLANDAAIQAHPAIITLWFISTYTQLWNLCIRTEPSFSPSHERLVVSLVLCLLLYLCFSEHANWNWLDWYMDMAASLSRAAHQFPLMKSQLWSEHHEASY